METLVEAVMSRVEHLLGRAGGPLHFRLLIMPLVVAFLAVRAGMKGAREGQPPLIQTFLANPAYRWHMFRSALKDIGKIFIVAMVLDTTYQILVLRAFYLGELLLVAVACAVVPYVVIRGPTALLMRRLYRSQSKPANQWAANPKEETEDRPSSTPKTDH